MKTANLDAIPRGLLFDLDGTLVDTAPDLARATNELRAHHGLAPLPYPLIRSQVSNGGSALVNLALGLDREHADHGAARSFLLDAYGRDVASQSRLFEGLDRLIEHWTQQPRAWGIVTNKPRAYAAPLIDALQLMPGALLCADDLPLKKPAPEPLWEAARRLSVTPDECWYIGDHLRDMQAARSAGMIAVAVGYGYIAEEDDIGSWPADLWFETPADLVGALLRNMGEP
ncbi:HAD-IA family hydrolase [Halomonas sp. ML-15]|uniref:HAD family hydrolase n=1 Tax=Halomonas sp. ML-15 TaxID=2773305 RepID=UPI00174775DD|nr:HAD-IA family hydrolase [Halomonas sp. ML-15]MBD3894346.1 HAD-IA family hydrolase [Halomonas sp. ML-15]